MEEMTSCSPGHREMCQVIEVQTLWCETTCLVWLPGTDTVVQLPAAHLYGEAVGAGFKKAWQERGNTAVIAVAGKMRENFLQEAPKTPHVV